MTSLRDVRNLWQKQKSKFAIQRDTRAAVLGDGRGTGTANIVVQNGTDFVWARDTAESRIFYPILNRVGVPLVHDLPVLLGYTDEEPEIEQVIRIYTEGLGGNTPITSVPTTPAHHQQHEFGGGDEVKIEGRLFQPGLVHPTVPASMQVLVNGFVYYYDEWRRYDGGSSQSLAGFLPASGYKVYVLIAFDPDTRNLVYRPGFQYAIGSPQDLYPSFEDVPAPSGNEYPLGWILLEATTTVVDWTSTNNNIGDARLHVGYPARSILDRLTQLEGSTESSLPLTGAEGFSSSSSGGGTTTTTTSLGWYNVRDYGAIGDGATNDTSAVSSAISAMNSAGGGILYFPKGKYLTTGGFNLASPCIVRGDGNTSEFGTMVFTSATQVICSSGSTSLFTVTDYGASFRDMALICSAGTASSGAGIKVVAPATGYLYSQQHYDNITVSGFYDCMDIQVAFLWHMDNCNILYPVRYGMKIANEFWEDWGNFSISNCQFHPGARNSTAAIRHESGGGAMISNCNIDGWRPVVAGVPDMGTIYRFDYGYDLAPTSDSSGLSMSNCVIENWGIDAIRVVSTGTIAWGFIVITGCEFGGYGVTGSAIRMTAATAGYIIRVIITGNVFFSTTTTGSAINLTKISHVRLNGNTNDPSSSGFPSFLTQSGCVDLLNFELAEFTQTVYDTAAIAAGTTTAGAFSDVDATNAKITHTNTSYGSYKVTFTFSHYVSGTGVDILWRLTDGTTNSTGQERYSASGADIAVITLSQIFTWAEGAHTVKLQKWNVAGTITVNQIQAVSGSLGLAMSVERIGT